MNRTCFKAGGARLLSAALAVALCTLAAGCVVKVVPRDTTVIHRVPPPAVERPVVIKLSVRDRQRIRAYFAALRHDQHPPGGFKSLPPGIRRQLQAGKRLPRGVAKQTLPDALVRRLTRLPDGFRWLRLGLDVVIVEHRSGQVRDLFKDAVPATVARGRGGQGGPPEHAQAKRGRPGGPPEQAQAKRGRPGGLPEQAQAKKGGPGGPPEQAQAKKGGPGGPPEQAQGKKGGPGGPPEQAQGKKGGPGGPPEQAQAKRGRPGGPPEQAQGKKGGPGEAPQTAQAGGGKKGGRGGDAPQAAASSGGKKGGQGGRADTPAQVASVAAPAFSDADRDRIRAFLSASQSGGQGKKGRRPVGGGVTLKPGQSLPKGAKKAPLPGQLERGLSALPSGYKRYQVGAQVVILDTGKGIVVAVVSGG